MVTKKKLKKIPFFWGFSEKQLDMLVEQESLLAKFKPNDIIIQEGDDVNKDLFIILEGRVNVTRTTSTGSEHVITTLEAGAIFGEISFLIGRSRTTNVVAADKVMTFQISSNALQSFGYQIHIMIKDKLIELLVRRLEKMNDIFIQKDRSNQQLIDALRSATLLGQ
ncbi:MAG: cyclic nucleotide-binding domain-containing protein [Magnetococcales bacterium]|nr:cyclic nucleotide-binding domain-containing protein [Magnetococcales bacterium]